jgi:hypothetical protein
VTPMKRLLVATGVLGIFALVGCQDEAITVYPVLLCKVGCPVITDSGETVHRRWVARAPERYAANPATQDVLVQSTAGVVESLPRRARRW